MIEQTRIRTAADAIIKRSCIFQIRPHLALLSPCFLLQMKHHLPGTLLFVCYTIYLFNIKNGYTLTELPSRAAPILANP